MRRKKKERPACARPVTKLLVHNLRDEKVNARGLDAERWRIREKPIPRMSYRTVLYRSCIGHRSGSILSPTDFAISFMQGNAKHWMLGSVTAKEKKKSATLKIIVTLLSKSDGIKTL